MRALILLLLALSQAQADPCAPAVSVVDIPFSLSRTPPLPPGARAWVSVPVAIPVPPDPACREEEPPADVLRGAPAPRGLLRGDDLVDPLTGRVRGRVTIGP